MSGDSTSIRERLARVDVRLWAVAASLLFSAWAGFSVAVPNDDAFLYLRTAQIFQAQGIGAAFDYYAWAAYPVLLGLVAALGLELFTAAYVLNAALFALLAFAFVSVCREFSAERRLLGLAALTILLFPEINEYRYYILRDTGFWAFSVLGLWWLIRYRAEASWKCCGYFCAAMLLAMLFRPEAALYLLLAPLCLLFDRRYRLQERYRLSGRLLLTGSGALLLCFLAGLALGLNLFRQMVELASGYAPFLQSLFDPASQQAAAEAIFGEHAANYSRRYLPLFLLAGLLAILVVELFYAVGMPFTLILAWGWWRNWLLPDRDTALPVIAFAAINLVTVLCFILLTRYLTSRYAMVFSLSLAIIVPFIAREMLAWAPTRTRAAAWLLILFFAFSAVDSYYSFGRSRAYLGQAIEWLEDNGNASSRLLTNNRAVAYASGMVAEFDQVQSRLREEQILATAPGDFIVVEFSLVNEQLLSRAGIAALLEPVAVFPDATEARLRIYRRR